MGNAREIRRNNETALGPAPSEPPALPPRPLVETIPNNTRVIENQDAGNKLKIKFVSFLFLWQWKVKF